MADKSDQYSTCVKESLAAIISIVILVLAATMLWQTFWSPAAEATAFARQKEILTLVLSLFGTVTGYYLGRVPAEIRAQKAEAHATDAQQKIERAGEEKGKAEQEKKQLANGIQRIADGLSQPSVAMRTTLGETTQDAQVDSMSRVRDELLALLQECA